MNIRWRKCHLNELEARGGFRLLSPRLPILHASVARIHPPKSPRHLALWACLVVAAFVITPTVESYRRCLCCNGCHDVVAGLPGCRRILLAYGLICLGSFLKSTKVQLRNDISYGVYIYVFPLQQLVALTFASHLSVGLTIALTVLLSVGLAAASWFVIEKPAARLKFSRTQANAAEALGTPGEIQAL